MDDRKLALHALLEKDAACVAVRGGKVEYSREKGINPLLNWLDQEDCPLTDACVADKVVGKAAAMLFAHAGASHVYALVISDLAAAALMEQGIPFAYEKRVPYIINRKKTGMCPMEQKVLNCSNPLEAFQKLKANGKN